MPLKSPYFPLRIFDPSATVCTHAELPEKASVGQGDDTPRGTFAKPQSRRVPLDINAEGGQFA